jgi:hypothetical protein
MRHDGKSELQRELSWFLVAYLTMLLGVLLGVHLLQVVSEAPAGTSQSPTHQEQVKMSSQAFVIDEKSRVSVR